MSTCSARSRFANAGSLTSLDGQVSIPISWVAPHRVELGVPFGGAVITATSLWLLRPSARNTCNPADSAATNAIFILWRVAFYSQVAATRQYAAILCQRSAGRSVIRHSGHPESSLSQ